MNIYHINEASYPNNSSGTNNTTNELGKDTYDILSQTQTIQPLIDKKDVDGIIDFFVHGDTGEAYIHDAIKILPVDLIEQVLPKIPQRVLPYLFNNFHGKLPGGYQSNFYAQHPTKLEEIKQTSMNKHPEKYSDKYKSVDFALFYADVQQAAQGNGIKQDDVFLSKEQIKNPHTPVRVHTESLIPVYIALRKMGYNHEELAE